MSSKKIKTKRILIGVSVAIVLTILAFIITKGVFIVLNYSSNDLNFKDVTTLEYKDYTLTDFLKENITCKDTDCTYKKEKIEYTISEITTLGTQDINVTIKYKDKEYEKTYNLEVVDKKAPVINLKERIVYIDKNTNFKAEDYLDRVSDNFDTLTNEQVEIINNVDPKISGEYEVTYKLKDNSNNEAEAKLKVVVRGNAPTSSETKPSVNNNSTNNTSDFSWHIETSGLLENSRVINNSHKNDELSKSITLGWDRNIKIVSKLNKSGEYFIEYSITSNNKEKVKSSKIISQDYTINYNFEDEGEYTIKISLRDMQTGETYEETQNLTLKEPDHLEDIKLVAEYKNDKAYIDILTLGGNEDNLELSKFLITVDGALIATEEELDNIIEVSEIEDKFILKYEKGKEYYILVGVQEGSIEKMASITIKK